MLEFLPLHKSGHIATKLLLVMKIILLDKYALITSFKMRLHVEYYSTTESHISLFILGSCEMN
jgi:hypothetical protein